MTIPPGDRDRRDGDPVTVDTLTTVTTVSYRDAATALWGEAGAYAYDAYDRIRAALYPELPRPAPDRHRPHRLRRLPRPHPRVLDPRPAHHPAARDLPGHHRGNRPPQGPRLTPARLTTCSPHEMLHAWLAVTGPRRPSTTPPSTGTRRCGGCPPPSSGTRSTCAAAPGGSPPASPTPPTCPEGNAPRTLVRKQQVGDVIHGTVTLPAGRRRSAPMTTTGARRYRAPPTEGRVTRCPPSPNCSAPVTVTASPRSRSPGRPTRRTSSPSPARPQRSHGTPGRPRGPSLPLPSPRRKPRTRRAPPSSGRSTARHSGLSPSPASPSCKTLSSKTPPQRHHPESRNGRPQAEKHMTTTAAGGRSLARSAPQSGGNQNPKGARAGALGNHACGISAGRVLRTRCESLTHVVAP